MAANGPSKCCVWGAGSTLPRERKEVAHATVLVRLRTSETPKQTKASHSSASERESAGKAVELKLHSLRARTSSQTFLVSLERCAHSTNMLTCHHAKTGKHAQGSCQRFKTKNNSRFQEKENESTLKENFHTKQASYVRYEMLKVKNARFVPFLSCCFGLLGKKTCWESLELDLEGFGP